MEYAQIAEALRGAGYTWVTASVAIGKSRTALVRVASRDIKSRYVAKALAALIDQPVTKVFPDVPEYMEPTQEEQREKAIERAREKLLAAGVQAV